MNDFKSILNEAMKIRLFEEEAFTAPAEDVVMDVPAGEAPVAPDAEAAPEAEAAIEAPVAPEITDELVATLTADNPAIAEVDAAEFKKGLEVEVEHFETVGDDINVIAKIVLDHLKEFPGKDYYGALATMEAGLAEESKEEPAEGAAEPEATEAPAEAPVEEPKAEDAPADVEEAKKGKKALAQTKNESQAAEIKKDEKEEKKEAAEEKAEEKKLKTEQAKDDKVENKSK